MTQDNRLRNCVATFIGHGNTSLRTIKVESVCHYQGFDPLDFAAEHERQMSRLSLTPAPEVRDE